MPAAQGGRGAHGGRQRETEVSASTEAQLSPMTPAGKSAA